MKALSIRQPWAWFILNGQPQKIVENRDWAAWYLQMQLKLCPIGTEFLIHASAGMTRNELALACEFAKSIGCKNYIGPCTDLLPRGGIVGSARLADVVHESESPWFVGPVGLVLNQVSPRPFVPLKGSLGFFEVPEDYNRK